MTKREAQRQNGEARAVSTDATRESRRQVLKQSTKVGIAVPAITLLLSQNATAQVYQCW
jgi:hypothetical protein